MSDTRITLSVVSHRQNALVNGLLDDLSRSCSGEISIIVTQNIIDPVQLVTEPVAGRVKILRNERVKGFGANHNAAFGYCDTPYFCICNPDIRLPSDPFPGLVQAIADPRVALAAPLVRSPGGVIEDSVRRFPTAMSLLKKIWSESREPDYATDRGPVEVDWAAGMFMLVRSDAFRAVGGFDEAYFLYYEDVDLCRRLHAAGRSIVYYPRVEVVHDARRASRRQPRLALHHLKSMLRFLSRR